MDIRFVKREDIEDKLWNSCVHYALNGRTYGYSWYLDNVVGQGQWDALIEGNYESVFPLVWNNKLLGYKQLYQPYLCQQLGLFSSHVCSGPRLRKFLDAIPSEFRYADINLNDSNKLIQTKDKERIDRRSNFILYLDKPYETIQEAYSTNLKRNIRKAYKHSFFLSTSIKPETFVAEVKKYHLAKANNIPEELYHTAHRVIYNCLHRGLGSFFVALDKETQELCAAIFFVFSGARMINLLNVTTPIGRDKQAMPFLLDAFIQQHSGNRRLIDFEGSSIEGIARFYKSFGAVDVPYYNLQSNKLPWWLSWRKR